MRLLAFLILLMQISLQAQTKRIHTGISIGSVITDQVTNDFNSEVYSNPERNLGNIRQSFRRGQNVSIPIILDISNKISLQGGIGFTNRSYSTLWKHISSLEENHYRSSLNLIELPLSLQYKFKLSEKIALIPSLGYSMDIITSPRYVYLFEVGSPNTANYDFMKMGYRIRSVFNSFLLSLAYETDFEKKGKIRFTYLLHFTEANNFHFIRGYYTPATGPVTYNVLSSPITHSMLSITYILPYSFGLRKL
jgi:hypothetical protein